MKQINVEVCIDNLPSLFNAQNAGAGRIELCSALKLGGLTPSAALVQAVVKHATVPVYAMIRPRDGDFLYSSDEAEMMLQEIHNMKKLGVDGLVFGVLDKHAMIDQTLLTSLMKQAAGSAVTFHRAIDCCIDHQQALEIIIAAGCERILTSGLAQTAVQGGSIIKDMVKQSAGRISIMAGSGVNSNNAKKLIQQTGVSEIHLSGKSAQATHMQQLVACGELAEFKAFDVCHPEQIMAVKQAIKSIE